MARWPISPAAGRPSPSPRGDRSWARDLCGHPMSPRGPVPDAMPTSSCGPPAATIHENWTSQLCTAFLSSWLAPAGSRGMQSFDISELAGPPDLKLLQADWAQGQRRNGARLDGARGRPAELKGLGSIPTYGVVWVQWCIPLKIHHWIHMMS